MPSEQGESTTPKSGMRQGPLTAGPADSTSWVSLRVLNPTQTVPPPPQAVNLRAGVVFAMGAQMLKPGARVQSLDVAFGRRVQKGSVLTIQMSNSVTLCRDMDFCLLLSSKCLIRSEFVILLLCSISALAWQDVLVRVLCDV